MHGNVLKVISVGQNEVCVELHSPLLKPTEDPYNLISWKKFHVYEHPSYV